MKFNEAGMTDFICLPLRPDELVTRISLLIRQVYPSDYAANVFRNGPFVFSRFPNKVLRDGKEIELTVKEFELACLLFRHIGQPLSRVTIEADNRYPCFKSPEQTGSERRAWLSPATGLRLWLSACRSLK